jgi:hypothetical protein
MGLKRPTPGKIEVVLAALFIELKRPTPGKKALVLAALFMGLKRPTPGKIEVVLAALFMGLKRPTPVVNELMLAALFMGLKRSARVMNELVLAALLIGLKRPAPGLVASVRATLHLGVLSPTRRLARPGSLRSAGQAAKLRPRADTTLTRRGRVFSQHGKEETTLQLRVVSLQTRSGPWAGSSPEGDEDSCAFSTSRIPNRDDSKDDPPSPVVPINAQKALPPPQREMVPYSLPVRPHRQLTKRDLGSFDFKLLNSIEAVANSAPYLGDVGHRNDLILDMELRTSNALTTFFRGGGVVELQPGYDLSRRDRA